VIYIWGSAQNQAEFRTRRVNLLFGEIPLLLRDLEENKKGNSKKNCLQLPSVPRTGLFYDPGNVGLTQRPRPPASALGFLSSALSQASLPCSENKKPRITSLMRGLRAQDWIRTSTPFRAPPPQGGLSTNFNTWAERISNKE
jgi:hypothetical protein